MIPCGPGPVIGPMPDPDGIKWVITWSRTYLIYPDIKFKCTTDVPIYLHAEVGCKPPWKIAGEHYKRGIVMHHDPEVIFPFRQSFCQEEHGMTLDHTIIFPCYPDCKIHWWRCLGRSTGLFAKWGASSSGFYNITCEEPPPQDELCHSYGPAGVGICMYYHREIGQAFQPTSNYILKSVKVRLTNPSGYPPAYYWLYVLRLATPEGYPSGFPFMTQQFTTPGLPPGTGADFTFTVPQTFLYTDYPYFQSLRNMQIGTNPCWQAERFQTCYLCCNRWGRRFTDDGWQDWERFIADCHQLLYTHYGVPLAD